MSTLKLETGAGDSYSEVAKMAKEKARETFTVEFEFNGVANFVTKDTNLDWLWRDYCNAWVMEWKTVGPNCVEHYPADVQKELETRTIARDKKREEERQEWEAKEKIEKESTEAKIKGVELEIIPEKLAEYKEYVAKNDDGGYGRAVIDYSENWAKLMQVELAAGKTIPEVANETQKGLGWLGITGFQYGCAVNGLSHFWKHGEEFRKWHNKGYGHEGKGVVNPAVLTLKS